MTEGPTPGDPDQHTSTEDEGRSPAEFERIAYPLESYSMGIEHYLAFRLTNGTAEIGQLPAEYQGDPLNQPTWIIRTRERDAEGNPIPTTGAIISIREPDIRSLYMTAYTAPPEEAGVARNSQHAYFNDATPTRVTLGEPFTAQTANGPITFPGLAHEVLLVTRDSNIPEGVDTIQTRTIDIMRNPVEYARRHRIYATGQIPV